MEMAIASLADLASTSAEAAANSPGLSGLLLLAVVLSVVIYRYDPPVPQTVVWASVPWIIAGSALQVLATRVQYPPYLVSLFESEWAYLVTLSIGGVAWLSILTVSTSRRDGSAVQYYVAAMGAGATISLCTFLIPHLGGLNLELILVYLVLLSVAFLASIVITISMGMSSPDVMDYTVITGSFVVFGALMHGTVTVLKIKILGTIAHTPVSTEVLYLALRLIRYDWIGVNLSFVWAWLLLLVYLGGATLIATRLAPYARARPRTVHSVLGLVGCVGVVSGVNDLVVMMVG